MPAQHEDANHWEEFDGHRVDYGEGKSREADAFDSATMMGTVVLFLIVLAVGAVTGFALTLWLT